VIVRSKKVEPFTWPDGLAEYDPAKWSSQAEWHLARCSALPPHMKLAKLAEIRLSVGRDPV